jgi:hypothetical protein
VAFGCRALSAAFQAAELVSFRIVLYAEGPGDAGGEVSRLPPPGELLEETHLGPAHALVRRCITRETPIPEAAIKFLCPLRVRVRHHKGSDLLEPRVVRQLLTWPAASRRPDFAIVFVDADEDRNRRSNLRAALQGLPLPHVLAVPVQEFESWLIADHAAVAQALSPAPNKPPAIEGLSRRQARNHLDQWIACSTSEVSARLVRLTLARTCDLAVLDRLSAFQLFRDDLRAALRKP